jgi:hypothetical protein
VLKILWGYFACSPTGDGDYFLPASGFGSWIWAGFYPSFRFGLDNSTFTFGILTCLGSLGLFKEIPGFIASAGFVELTSLTGSYLPYSN